MPTIVANFLMKYKWTRKKCTKVARLGTLDIGLKNRQGTIFASDAGLATRIFYLPDEEEVVIIF